MINSPELLRKVNEIEEWLGAGTVNGFGRQFAGKDTQLAPLSKQFGVPIIGGGDILRNSIIPEEVQESMDRGDLIASDDYKRIVLPYLSQPDFEGKPLLLSAVGRMIGEEAGVLLATEAAGHPTKAAVLFDITRDESTRRLLSTPSRGRADDTPEGLARRLDFYDEYTEPVLDVYEKMGLLVRVNAMPETEVVFASFVHQLHDRALTS